LPRKVAIRAARTDAYLKEDVRTLGSVLVVRSGGGVTVFSAQCPHAGCDVAPSSKDGKLACPCHESRFELDGRSAGGPAPRALDALEAEVRDGRVLVRFQRFQVGIADKRVV